MRLKIQFSGSGGTGTASIDTYIISGGLSSDTLTDLFIDRVEPSTFKIKDVELSYPGATDIPVPPGIIDGVVYFYNDGGVGNVGVDTSAPPETIIIATFDSNATEITRYQLSGNFAINTELNKIMEKTQHKIVGTTTEEEDGPNIKFTWTEPIKIYLPSMAAGPGYVNTIPAGNVSLAPGDVVYATVDRQNNTDISYTKALISNANLTSDDEILFFHDANGLIRNYVYDGDADVSYTNADPSVIEVGGITAGTTFDNTSFDEFVDMLLYPELFGTLTNPSNTFTASITGFREIGEVIGTINFNSTFNRGSINPQYESSEPFRAGLPNQYTYTGTGLTNQAKADLSDAQSISNYTVLLGGQSWTGRVAYDAGVQPKGSKGTDFNAPLPAGQTNNITRTITGVYPVFATTSNITTMTKQTLANHGTQLIYDLVGESGSDKQTIQVPQVWGTLSALAQWNPLSSSWDTIPTNTFTETATTKEIQGNTINYRQYTHNGGLIGARRIRFTF